MNASSTYYVLSAELAQNLNYTILTDDNYETTRKSLDGTLVIVEHDGSVSLSGGTEYSFQQASVLMSSDAWLAEDELI